MKDKEKLRARRWRRDTYRLLSSIDPHWNTASAAFACAVVMIGVAAIGTDPTALTTLTGYSGGLITRVLRRLRKSKLLIGQTLRIDWDDKENGWCAVLLDGLVASGEAVRVPDDKRSAAAKQRSVTRQSPAVRRPRAVIAPGAVFSPKFVKSNPLYLHPKWLKKGQTAPTVENESPEDQVAI